MSILLDYTYWQDGNMWIGYLKVYPDYMTQGVSIAELKENLTDIYKDLLKDYSSNTR